MSEIKAVVFDWAGTVVDFGCFAPVQAFVSAFAEHNVEVTSAEAREPMGRAKRDHIEDMLAMPRIAKAWESAHGGPATQDDVEAIYNSFLPLNESCVGDFADLIPGAAETMEWLRARDIKIGSTTGYTRSIMSILAPLAAKQGFEPESLVCSDDGFEGRPSPLGMYQSMVNLGVYPPECMIKVDDTAAGIAEGVAAGCKTIGISLSSNYVGQTLADLDLLSPEEKEKLRKSAESKLTQAGADICINTIADLPAALGKLKTT